MHFHTPMIRTCVRTPTLARMLTLIYSHTQTRTAPEQNSIINGLIARVELLWESEPATLNKIKPLLYIFIIPNRVLNCKCVSETHRCPSLLPSLSFPRFPCCLTTATLSSVSPSSRVTCIYAHARAHTQTHTHTHMRLHILLLWHACTATIKQSY